MGTNCAPLLADIFLYSYEAEFIQSLLSAGKERLASQFNFTYRYIDDVLSINNPDFENYLGQMYHPELEIKDNTAASYLDLLLSIGKDGQLHTSLYDKQKRSTEGCSNFKGPETRQVQERLVSTLEHMQVPKWDRTRCPEE